MRKFDLCAASAATAFLMIVLLNTEITWNTYAIAISSSALSFFASRILK